MTNPYSADQYPDLSLAMTPSVDVASGTQQTSMPAPPRSSGEPAMLQCDDPGREINQMGISPSVPYYDLMLACPPDCSMSMEPQYPQPKEPTFTSPSFTVPANRPYDFQAPGIDHIPEYAPDPYTGDLLDFDKPTGLSQMAVNQSNPLTGPPDPDVPDLGSYDYPSNLLMPSTMQVDPSLPDLQQPELEQDVHMLDRPGEMVDSGGDAVDLGPDGDNDDDDGPMPDYSEEYQTPGLSHRQRKMDTLYRGLKGDL